MMLSTGGSVYDVRRRDRTVLALADLAARLGRGARRKRVTVRGVCARATIALAVSLLLAVSAASPGQQSAAARPAGAPVDPCYETDPLLIHQDLVMNVLPVSIVYQPPGRGGEVVQVFTLGERFGSTLTLTQIQTEEQTMSAGLAVGSATYKFLSASAQQTDTTTVEVEEETGTSLIYVKSDSWASGLGPISDPERPEDLFPAEGDLIVFYLRPRFRATYDVGHFHSSFDCELDHSPNHVEGEPRFVGMVPVDAPTWELRAATVWELRNRKGLGQGLTDSDVEDLLALDPFTLPSADVRLGTMVPKGLVATIANAPRTGANPDPYLARARFGEDPVRRTAWQACDDYFQWETGASLGSLSSVETTTRSTFEVSAEGSVTIPVYGVEVTPSVGRGAKFTFEYSQNSMTEQESSTTAFAIYGSDGADCDPDAPRHLTEIYYDGTLAALAFTNGEMPPANAMSAPGAAPAGRDIVFEDATGQRVHTRADREGRYGLYLEPGTYSVWLENQGPGRGTRHQFEVHSRERGAVRLESLIGETADVERPARGLEPAMSTPTPTPTQTPETQQPVRDVRLPTATPTSTPGRPDIRPPLR